MTDSHRFHWGPAWTEGFFSWVPRGVHEVLHNDFKLNLSQIAVLETLVSFRKRPDDYLVWASMDTIAERTGTTYDTARRAVLSLLKCGLLQEHCVPSRGRARVYDLHHFLMVLADKKRQVAPAVLRVMQGGDDV